MSICAVLLLCVTTGAGLPGNELCLGTNQLVMSVTTNHYIPCTLTGRVDIALQDAVQILEHPDMLDLIQREYALQLPAGERPEFTIKACGTNQWSFLNKENQHSEVHEISRIVAADGGSVEIVYYTRGKRFFGWFRAAIAIRISSADANSTAYEVKLCAFPESSFSRFFARHLGLVEKFFRDKSDFMTKLTINISRGIVERMAENPQTAAIQSRNNP